MLGYQLRMHLIVFIWGFTSILGKAISMPAVEMVFYRTLIATVALAALLPFLRRSFRVSWKNGAMFLGTGLLVGLHWILFFASAKVSSVSICLAGMATGSLFASILEPLIKRVSVKWYEVALGLLVIGGLYTIFLFEFDHVLGLVLALGAAFLSALFSIINSLFVQKGDDPLVMSFYEMAGATLCTVLFFPIYLAYLSDSGSLDLAWKGYDWLFLGILALVCTVYPFFEGIRVMRVLSAFYVNLTVNLEPVYGILMAMLIYREHEALSPGFYVGTLVILGAVLMYPSLQKLDARRKTQDIRLKRLR